MINCLETLILLEAWLHIGTRDNNLTKQDVSNTASNNKVIAQQREAQGVNNLKPRGQIKTMISITSCNLVEISH